MRSLSLREIKIVALRQAKLKVQITCFGRQKQRLGPVALLDNLAPEAETISQPLLTGFIKILVKSYIVTLLLRLYQKRKRGGLKHVFFA